MSWLGLFVAIGLDTGARHEAIMGLTWERVDLERGLINFRDPKMRETKKRRVSSAHHSKRLAPVIELARLDAPRPARGWRADWAGVRLRHDPRALVWVPAGVSRQWAWVSPHVLRHTFITLGLRSGMSVWDVAGIAGASPTMVQQTYGHHSTDERARALLDRRHEAPATSGSVAA